MAKSFDVKDFVANGSTHSRYEKRIAELQASGITTTSIELAVKGALDNIQSAGARSFVIYGEPQSGKTEMMIALTARLLDGGHKLVLVLMNDSVQLLEQNLDRFLRSGLDPAPKKFNEILDPSIIIGTSTWVIFCKKNSADLQKLTAKIGNVKKKVIIDDEADYATPNGKVNKQEQTKINELVGNLISSDGIYIGVTATPARLDLNHTFHNQNERWIDFPPHALYTGQETFFPTTNHGISDIRYGLELLPDQGDDPKYLRRAFFSFLINVSYLNTQINKETTNYCMLIHTSGKKVDHTKDYQQVVKLLSSLRDASHTNYERHLQEIFELAQKKYPDLEHQLTQYTLDNIMLSDVVVMNSNTERNAAQYKRATSPATMFTIAIGGNIVSRGVTFDNLLSMFFTRDVKHKIQQDTYIQRARMFGSRGRYLEHFELHIPKKLYLDWQKCFVFHRLALSSIRAGKGSPIWLEDQRIAAASSASIDRAAVSFDSGEMSWELFDYLDSVSAIVDDPTTSARARLRNLSALVGESSLPQHVLDFINNFSPEDDAIAFHKTTHSASTYSTNEDGAELRRKKGFISTNNLEKTIFPKAIHHIKIFKNDVGHARVFYKYSPESGTVTFLKNSTGSVVS